MTAAVRRLAGATAVVAAVACMPVTAVGTTGTASAATTGTSTSTSTSTTVTVARWKLDEPYGATVAHDASGHHHDGSIGTAVRPGVRGYYDTAFRFTPPSTNVNDPQHLVRVPDAPGLDPGWKIMHISLRIRTGYTGHFNIVQKGQAATPGGFWKVQMDDGYPSCVFLGVTTSGDRVTAAVKYGKRVNNGVWHHIVCDKYRYSIRLRVDGSSPAVTYKRVGHIDNTWALVMGGKVSCHPDTSWVGCDYYRGDLDSVILSMSS